ncbi:MAG: hypothetical protein NT027_01230, partial [Proteobacteria bacterium]|nr:hypothetical protein [Pseudomonadota bacterium]
MFNSSPKVSTATLFTSKVSGDEFFKDAATIEPGFIASSEITVKKTINNINIKYPIEPHCGISVSALKNKYHEIYGPYSAEVFTEKMNSAFVKFEETTKMSLTRLIVRKMWIFKEIFELCDDSLNMIVEWMSKLIPSLYMKATEVLDDAEIKKKGLKPRDVKNIDIAIKVISRVNNKIRYIIARDSNILKLLSPEALVKFVEEASPHMLSKINCLPWIEPEVALMAAPGYNIYWSEFWFPFLVRNFKLSSDLCQIIADFMPIALQGETFLDYFR